MNPFSFFSKIYFINRDSRTDRLEKITAEFAKMGIEAERFPAVEGGEKGCMLSHVNIIRKAKQLNQKQILVLEDDAEFLVTDLEYYNAVFSCLPPLWHLLYLGGNCTQRLVRHNDYMLTAKGVLCAHAVAYHESIYNQIVTDARHDKVKVIDTYLLGKIQPRGRSFIASKFCVNQRPCYSDIQNYPVNYSDIKEKFERFKPAHP